MPAMANRGNHRQGARPHAGCDRRCANIRRLPGPFSARSAGIVAAIMGVLATMGCRERETALAPPPAAADRAPDDARRSNRLSAGLKFNRRTAENRSERAATIECPRLIDVAESVGLSHVYLNGAAGQALMVEATGGGCGWIDYDRDGQWDVYLNQGGDPAATTVATRPSDQLFRNVAGRHFEPVTDAAGIDERKYSQG